MRVVSPSMPLLAILGCVSSGCVLFGCAGGDDGSGDAATGSASAPTGPGTSTAGDDDDGSPTGPTAPSTSGDADPTVTPGTDDGPDTGDDTTTAGQGDPGHYLLTIDNAASPPALVRIDLDAVSAEVVCELPGNSAYDSLVFARDGVLYGNNVTQGRLDTLNPCNCGFQLVGPTSAAALVLTLDADDGLYAIDPTLDALSRVDRDTGLADVIGGLALDFAGTGAAWSDDLTGVYAVEDASDELYAIDDVTGVAAATVGLDVDVTTPGLAIHPDGTFWMCSGPTLYELDPLSGAATEAGTLTLAGACRNLTAPRTSISCLD